MDLQGGHLSQEVLLRDVPLLKRHAFLPSDERWEEVAMYYGQDLLPGSGVAGPAIVEDVDTTILVPRGAVLARNEFADFVMTLGQRELEYRA